MAGVLQTQVKNQSEVEQWLRGNVFALDNVGRGDEIPGLTIYVKCPDHGAQVSPLVRSLEARGVTFEWNR